jgi:drug/metabolite transporter (DMT)-like permease
MVLISAVLHAYWNLLFKKSENKAIFAFLFVWAAILLYTPLFLVLVPSNHIPWQGWLCILGTGSVYCFYFLLLGRSYAHGDLSHAYPIARGLAPVLTLAWALVFLSERPSPLGLAGIVLVVLSVFLFHPPTTGGSFRGMIVGLRQPASLSALATGISISIYSVVDKIGVSYVDPAVYIYMTFLFCGLLLVPFFLRWHGIPAIRSELSTSWKKALVVGFLGIFAYLVVLFAMQLADVIYIIPLRSTSILFAVVFGFEVLGEEKTALKLLATACMLTGVLFIALA